MQVLNIFVHLYLLDDVGKMLEALLVGRIEGIMAAYGIEPADNQFGFRMRRSTDDVVRALHWRLVRSRDSRKWAIAVGLNIRNAFNSMD